MYSEKEIDLFFEGFAPLLNFENIERIQVGRQLWIDLTKSNQPIGHFLYNLFMLRTGQRKEELLITLDNEGKKLKDIDPCASLGYVTYFSIIIFPLVPI